MASQKCAPSRKGPQTEPYYLHIYSDAPALDKHALDAEVHFNTIIYDRSLRAIPRHSDSDTIANQRRYDTH